MASRIRIHSSVGKSHSPINTTLVAKQQKKQPINAPKLDFSDPKFNFDLSKIPISSPHSSSQLPPTINRKLGDDKSSDREERETEPKNSETAVQTFAPSPPEQPQEADATKKQLQQPELSAKSELQQPKADILAKIKTLSRYNFDLTKIPISAPNRLPNLPPVQSKLNFELPAPNRLQQPIDRRREETPTEEPKNRAIAHQSTPLDAPDGNNSESRTNPTPQFGHSLANIAISNPLVQPKLTISTPGDRYEKEADTVAARVVERINTPNVAAQTPRSGRSQQGEPDQSPSESEKVQPNLVVDTIQRKCAECEKEGQEGQKEEEEKSSSMELIQPKSTTDVPGDKYEQEGDLGKSEAQTRLQENSEFQPGVLRQAVDASVPNVQADFETALNRARGGGSPLDNTFRAKVEPAMGADFSGVKVHTDAEADRLNRSIQAKAFTTGQDIFFKKGEYEPGSQQGQELLAHELTHVVQQKGVTVARERIGFKHEQPSISPKITPSSSRLQRRRFTAGRPPRLVFQTRSIPQWRRFLQGSNRDQIATELNWLMGLATERHLYSAIPSERQRQEEEFRSVRPEVGNYEYVGLMVALLDTPNIHLLASTPEIAQATGILLPQFIRAWYTEAINLITRRSIGEEGVPQTVPEDVEPDRVASFLIQAQGARQAWIAFTTRERERSRVQEEARRRRVPSGYGELAAGMRSSTIHIPQDLSIRANIISQAMANMQAAAVAAIGEVLQISDESRRNARRIFYQRLVRRNFHVLQGVIREVEHREALERQVASMNNAVVDALFAAAGVFASGLRTAAQLAYAIGSSVVKNMVSNMHTNLFEETATDLSERIPNAFHRGLEILENELDCQGTGCPDEVTNTLRDIRDGVPSTI